jgi:SsrA-binding protein
MRDRKLLLQKRELQKLHRKTNERGLTIAALRMFINEHGRAKLDIALARGKKAYDKRDSIKEKDLRREQERGDT